MSFFGNLFKSRTCSICNSKLGITEQKELADGAFLCNKCANKLSKWFTTDARKHSTPKQILQQIKFRAKNEISVVKFNATRIIGRSVKVYLDENNRKFMVAETNDLQKENPDVLDASDIINVMTNLEETKHELFDRDNNGRTIPFNPRRYDFSYDFYVTIDMRHPFCTHRRFKLNDSSIWVRYDYLQSRGMRGFAGAINANGSLMGNILDAVADGITNRVGGNVMSGYPPEYMEYQRMLDDVRISLMNMHKGMHQIPQNAPKSLGNGMGAIGGIYGQQTQYIPQSKNWFCPNCGAQNSGMFCQHCGTKKPNNI